jgi:hypothetical protein
MCRTGRGKYRRCTHDTIDEASIAWYRTMAYTPYCPITSSHGVHCMPTMLPLPAIVLQGRKLLQLVGISHASRPPASRTSSHMGFSKLQRPAPLKEL